MIGEHGVGACLWEPRPSEIAESRLTDFMEHAAETCHAPTEWEPFRQWALTCPENFWSLLWSFTGVVSSVSPSKLLTGNGIFETRYFPEARLNYAENLLSGAKDLQEAIIFHGENGVRRSLSGEELFASVLRLQQAFRAAGVGVGDRVAAITANIPEAIAAALATASLGAVWSSCSPDFGVNGILERVTQIKPKLLFAVNGYSYNGKWFDTTGLAEKVFSSLPSAKTLMICDYETGDIDLDDSVTDPEAELEFAQLPFDHPLYIMFSSGTTGLPKCIVHGAGGVLLQHLKEHQLHIDLRPEDRLLFFTTCGWMMWNWIVSALASRVSLILYDGSPLHPEPSRLFDIVASERVTAFGISARYLESTYKAGLTPRTTHDLSALRVVMSTGSPLAPHCFDHVYKDWVSHVRLASMSGGTDILGCFATGNPNLPVHRGEIQCLALGMDVQVFDETGEALGPGESGELVCAAPHPSQPVEFLNDPGDLKYKAAYFETYPGVWHHGDWCQRTENGGLIIYGRSDATLNPGGVRIGTAEIYRQVEQVEEVLESVVIGQSRESETGEILGNDTRVVLFVRLKDSLSLTEELKMRIKLTIRENTSPRHVPEIICQVPDIPRTKSGKIVELAVREVVHGRPVKNQSALANPEALEAFANHPDLA